MGIRMGAILRRFREALAGDDILATWCTANLGRPALIQVGNEPTDDPRQWRVPAVVLVPDRRDAGQTVSEHRATILAECRLQIERVTPLAGEPRPVREYAGVYALDEFAEQVAAALIRGLASTSVSLDVTGEVLETQEFYPIMVADLRITITTPVIIGGEITLE